MTRPDERALLQALGQIQEPDLQRDLVSAGAIRELRIDGGDVRFLLALQRTATPEAADTKSRCEAALMALPDVASVQIKVVNAPPARPAPAGGSGAGAGLPGKRPIPGVRHVVAVSSGKGGVGKSTVCVNLACAASQMGLKVGILDGDIYGPNIPMMLGAKGKPEGTNEKIFPFVQHGLQMMSMGLLVGEDQPMVWRGPMLNKAITQFMYQVDWQELDLLLVDMPPGTGDVQLTLTQNTDLSGAVVVTTPQQVSVLDVKKAVRMFEKIETPVLGIVENMSWFQPPGSEERYALFGEGGGRAIEKEFGTPLLGQIPIGMEVREGGDSGVPITIGEPDGAIAQAFRQTAEAMMGRIEELSAAPR